MKRLIWLILGLYVVLAVVCSAVNPVFEAPDEQHHYFTALQIAETRQLPVASDDSHARQEAAQPPLYYLLSALLVTPIDTSVSPNLWPNPHVRPGHFDSLINVNAYAHTPEEGWPWQGRTLAVHLMRLVSVLLGLGTLVFIYASGRLIWPEKPRIGLLATALVAFLPQYIFLHSAVTNDTLIVFFSSAALWQIIRLWQDETTPWQILALGITVGSAMLSKTTGVLLLAVAGLAILFLSWREGKRGFLIRNVALLLAPVVLLTGWMYWRNWTLYEDVLAVSVFVERAGGDRQLTVGQALSQLDRVWQSSIAVFGWMNLTAPSWVYWVWNVLVALGLVGLVVQVLRLLRNRLTSEGTGGSDGNLASRLHHWLFAAILILWPMLVFLSWLLFMMRTPADQGRLLFPALLPVSLGLAIGLCQWGRKWAFPVVSLLTLSTAVYCVFMLIPQTYQLPSVIEEASIPPEAAHLNHDMGTGLELVASEVGSSTAKPGDTVDLTFYWRNHGVTTTAAIVLTEVVGRGYVRIGALPDAYHGGGLYPSSLWPIGEIVKEDIRLPLADDTIVPTLGRVFVKLDGQEMLLEVGSVKVVPRPWPEPSKAVVAQVGDGIALSEASLGATTSSPGDTVPVHVRWQISAGPGKDLTTFVHLGDPTQPPLVQADGPALGGDWPTRVWDAGTVLDDRYDLQLPLDIPSGQYPVHLGLYDPQTGQRLPVWVDGERQAYDALLVGYVNVP